MAKFCFTNKAVEDLTDIWNYTYDTWSEKQADAYYGMLLDYCRKIAENPELSGKRYDEIRNGLRGIKAGKHIIFYWIVQTGDIEIIRILHGNMDIPNRLTE
ncbi:MAG: type II toxin-antitoxin system RelE/ParE family toxin [Bacteroides sp.]|nr:type II toxin-antitoxin system RelE/ParE family toxin [Bacteroides sp.]